MAAISRIQVMRHRGEKEDWGGGGGGGRESMITALKVKMAMEFQMIHKESV